MSNNVFRIISWGQDRPSELLESEGNIGHFVSHDQYRAFSDFFHTTTYRKPDLTQSPTIFSSEEILWFILFSKKSQFQSFPWVFRDNGEHIHQNNGTLGFRVIAENVGYGLENPKYIPSFYGDHKIIYDLIIKRLIGGNPQDTLKRIQKSALRLL